MTPAVRITARRPGFRRAGLAHPAEPVVHPAGTFSDAQLEQLRAEPNLAVEIVDTDPASSRASRPKGGKGGNPQPGAEPPPSGAEAAAAEGAVGAPSANLNTPEGRSGTAREAPGTFGTDGNATAAAPSGGVQPAAPHEEAPAPAAADQAKPAPVAQTRKTHAKAK